MCTICMQPNSKRLAVASAAAAAAEVLGLRRKMLKERRQQISNSGGCGGAAVSRRDDDRMNWRDPRCPLDVTAATNVLAHTSQAPLSVFFSFERTQTNTGLHPHKCHLVALLGSFAFFLPFFFTMATVHHADGVARISLELGTFWVF